MNNNLLAELSLQQLRETITIREKIEDLEKELDSIVLERPSTTKSPARRKKSRLSTAAAMGARWTTRKEKPRLTKPATAKAKGRLSGAPLKEAIVGTLKAAGKPGATVKDLAAKLGKGYGNVSVWFHTTGKSIREIKKVAPGRFAWGA